MTNILISESAAAAIISQLESSITALKSISANIADVSDSTFNALPSVPEWNHAVDSALSDAKNAGKAKGTELSEDALVLLSELESLKEQVQAHVREQIALSEETAAAFDVNVPEVS